MADATAAPGGFEVHDTEALARARNLIESLNSLEVVEGWGGRTFFDGAHQLGLVADWPFRQLPLTRPTVSATR